MKINVNKHLFKKEEINKSSYKSASKTTNIQQSFSNSDGKNIEFSPKTCSKEEIFYLLNKNNKKINQINKQSRNIINTQPCESSLKLFSFRRKYTDFNDKFNTNCLKKSVSNSNCKNHIESNILNNSCCSLKEFRKNIIIDYTNNYLKKNKINKNKSVTVYENVKNYIDDTASSTNNFNNSSLLYKRHNYNNSCYISNKKIKKVINVNLKIEKVKNYNKSNSINLNNRTNTSTKKKINNKIIISNFKPYSNLESYIFKNNPNINLIKVNNLSTKYSKYLNLISKRSNRGEMSPDKNNENLNSRRSNRGETSTANNYGNDINLHTEKKINVKKQKSHKKTFNNSIIYDHNKAKKEYKKFNKIFPNNNSIIKCTRNKRRNNSQITINKSTINSKVNKSEFGEKTEDYISVEEIHFDFVKIAQKQKMFFQSKKICNY